MDRADSFESSIGGVDGGAAAVAVTAVTPHRVNGLPRPASAGDIASIAAGLAQRDVAGSGGLAAPTTSKNNSGSELFDALLMAATGNAGGGGGGGGEGTPGGGAVAAAGGSPGEQQVTSKHAPIPRQRSRLWHTAVSLGEVDSLQNAVDAFKVRVLPCCLAAALFPAASGNGGCCPHLTQNLLMHSLRTPRRFHRFRFAAESRVMRQADDEIASGQHALETGSVGAAAKRASPGSAGTPPPPQGFGRPRRGAGLPRRGSMGNLIAVSSPDADTPPLAGAQLPPAGPSAPYQLARGTPPARPLAPSFGVSGEQSGDNGLERSVRSQGDDTEAVPRASTVEAPGLQPHQLKAGQRAAQQQPDQQLEVRCRVSCCWTSSSTSDQALKIWVTAS